MSPTAETTDDVFRLHAGGKLEIRHRVPLETRADLERVYTPATATGVARVRTAANGESCQ